MICQKCLTHARLVIETMQRCFRGDLDQIAIAFFVFGQHEKVIVSITIGRRALNAMIILFADVQLAANDGLDSRGLRGVHEVYGAKNIAVVGHGHSRHA